MIVTERNIVGMYVPYHTHILPIHVWAIQYAYTHMGKLDIRVWAILYAYG